MTKTRISALLLAGCILAAVLAGCGKKEDSSTTVSTASTASTAEGDSQFPEDGGFKNTDFKYSDDKYRTFYEIFPYAFYDSDGNGKGDLNGITQKLDYLNDGDPKTTDDLGIDGIWLMPIMESPSYHKYNVADYYKVDSIYGTNDDFKNLLDEAHKRNINIIIDLVINHSSRQCEWFQKALEELEAGKTDGYAQYYHFEQNRTDNGWRKAGVGDWYYEGDFDDDMPDLNLQNPDLRKELQEIVKYWLDMGVDGFRLDAVMWFESVDGNYGAHDHDKSIEDLKWLYDYAKTIKEDVYMVGECWDSGATISNYYKSGIDSFFNFDMEGSSGKVNLYVNSQDAKSYVEYIESWQQRITENNPNAIDAKFISNHDTVRSAEFVVNETRKRLDAAVYILAPGNPYIYYGEEIEMEGNKPDPDLRRGMLWSTTDAEGYVKRIPGGTKLEEEPTISVESAQKDENSLLNFYKRVISLRNQNPEIARGTIKSVVFEDNKAAAGFVSTYNDSSVLVLYNFGNGQSVVDIPESTFKVNKVTGYLLAHIKGEEFADDPEYDDTMALNGQKLIMPAHSVFILR